MSVYDVGLTNKTEADGMAVARMSAFVATVMREMLAGIYTAPDADLLKALLSAYEAEGLRLEPSATAALFGPEFLLRHPRGEEFCAQRGMRDKMGRATHILWTTGDLSCRTSSSKAFLHRQGPWCSGRRMREPFEQSG